MVVEYMGKKEASVQEKFYCDICGRKILNRSHRVTLVPDGNLPSLFI